MFCWLSFKITTQKKIVSGPNELLSRKVFTALVPEFEVCGKKSMDLFFFTKRYSLDLNEIEIHLSFLRNRKNS